MARANQGVRRYRLVAMMSDLERLTHRQAIVDLLVSYATAIDTQDWKLLDTLFLPDADCDYSEAGGFRAPYPKIRAWLEEVLAPMQTQHMLTNHVIDVQDGEATSVTYLQAEHRMFVEGAETFYTFRGIYRDRLVRSGSEWAIAARARTPMWSGTLP
jgi:3-phenylpropionate/cinnamic acid dioxygenase small subunit